MSLITLYHGSDHIVECPALKKGKLNNDYGQGFYCTTHRELACEWASKDAGKDGFVNEYRLDTSDLAELDLSQYTILHWLTILVQHRTFSVTSEIAKEAMVFLTDHYTIDTSSYDLIRGYRADDSYFSFVRDFLNNTISVQRLSYAMKLGKLGIQNVLVSEKAFEHLSFGKADSINTEEYHVQYIKRDSTARSKYQEIRSTAPFTRDDIFIMDLIRGGIDYGDSRLQSGLS